MDAPWPDASPDRDLPAANAVRCWRIAIDTIGDDVLRRLTEVLSDDEQQRAQRFLRPIDRRRSIAARAGLRVLLGNALGEAARAIRFVTNDMGKPALANGGAAFNVSHSGDIVLIALTAGAPVGIDVEQIRRMPDRDAIIRRFLHPGEVADLAGLTGAPADLAFFRCWVRKEAVTKALGLGMSLPLDHYRVSCAPERPAALLTLRGPYPAPEQWSLYDLPLGAGHLGAVAAPVRPLNLLCRELLCQTLDPATAAPLR